VAKTPGYAGPINCTDPLTGASTCDNFAYPAGDLAVNNRGMSDADAYAPFPNAILMNCEYLVLPMHCNARCILAAISSAVLCTHEGLRQCKWVALRCVAAARRCYVCLPGFMLCCPTFRADACTCVHAMQGPR
jgi:hypothetical protein